MFEMNADYYFESVDVKGFTEQNHGTFLTYEREDDNGLYYAAKPLFNPIDGISPSGTDYKQLGCSDHSRTIENVQKWLLEH